MDIGMTQSYMNSPNLLLNLERTEFTALGGVFNDEKMAEVDASFAEIRGKYRNSSFQSKHHLIGMLDGHGKIIIDNY
jgi:hypothetical protein